MTDILGDPVLVQVAVISILGVPLVHAKHAVDPVSLEYWPASQLVHSKPSDAL